MEYLIRLLKDYMNVAVLSRGYKRKSHGFVLANKDTTMWDIGDEPYQMLKKFPDITMAVDGNRIRGIQKLIDGEAGKEIDVILLDDAFQHRYVKPGINILLVDYHRLIIYDELLPAGRLREPVKSKDRADIVIITKCPKDMKPMEFRVLTKALKLYPYQHLFFSTHEYDSPKPVFPELASHEPLLSLGILDSMGVLESLDPMSPIVGKNILLLTGIASPEQMEHDLTAISPKSITMLTFGDHHAFKQKDTWKAAVAKMKPLDEAAKQQATMVLTAFQGAAKNAGKATTKEELQGALMQAMMPLMMMGGMGGGDAGVGFGDDEDDEVQDAAE